MSVRATSHRLAIAAPLKKTRVLQEGTRIPNTRLFTRIGPSRQWRQIRKQAYKLVETQVAIPLSLRFNYHRFTRSTQTHEKGRVYSVAPFLEGAHLRGGWYGTLYISQSGPEKRTWKVPFRLDADKKRLFVSVGKQEHRAMDWASKVFDPYARYLMGR